MGRRSSKGFDPPETRHVSKIVEVAPGEFEARVESDVLWPTNRAARRAGIVSELDSPDEGQVQAVFVYHDDTYSSPTILADEEINVLRDGLRKWRNGMRAPLQVDTADGPKRIVRIDTIGQG